MANFWTGRIVGKMHNYGITYEELANSMGFSKAYLSMVLNGKRSPKNAEKRFNEALDKLIKERSA